MAWYWWALIGVAVVYEAIAILTFLIIMANLLALDTILDTKATSSAIWPTDYCEHHQPFHGFQGYKNPIPTLNFKE